MEPVLCRCWFTTGRVKDLAGAIVRLAKAAGETPPLHHVTAPLDEVRVARVTENSGPDEVQVGSGATPPYRRTLIGAATTRGWNRRADDRRDSERPPNAMHHCSVLYTGPAGDDFRS